MAKTPSYSMTGVRLAEIIRAASEIRKWLPDVGLAGVRLHAGAVSDVQVEQPCGRTDKYGQFVMAVESAQEDPDDYLIGPLLPSRGKTFAKLKGSIVSS